MLCRPTDSFFTTGTPVPSICTYRIRIGSPTTAGRSNCTARRNLRLLALSDISANGFCRALHRFGSHLQAGQAFHLLRPCPNGAAALATAKTKGFRTSGLWPDRRVHGLAVTWLRKGRWPSRRTVGLTRIDLLAILSRRSPHENVISMDAPNCVACVVVKVAIPWSNEIL
jgi:hypothetical protein